MRQVEEALARQVIYGGDLVTNLLEVAWADEGILIELLAESTGLRGAPAGQLPVAPEALRALVPRDLAVESSVVPIAFENNKLIVAVVEPLASAIVERLIAGCGIAIEQRIATAARVRQAIARAYGMPLERRMDRLALLLDAPAPPPSFLPRPFRRSFPSMPAAQPAVEQVHTPAYGTAAVPIGVDPPSRAPGATPTLTGLPVTVPPQPEPEIPAVAPADTEPPMPFALERRRGLVGRGTPKSFRVPRRRRGPITFKDAGKEAKEAADRDALLELFFDFSRQFFDYVALFVVHGDIAEGRDAFGEGASRDRVVGVGVPLDLPGMMSGVRDSRVAVVARAPAGGLESALLSDLRRPLDAEIAIVPLVVRARVVAMLTGDCGSTDIDRTGVEHVVAFAAVIGQQFERIIVRRKLDGFIAGSRATGAGRVNQETLAATMPPPATTPPPPRAWPAHSVPPPLTDPPPPSNLASLRPIGGPPIPREDPDSDRPTPPISQPDASVGSAPEVVEEREIDARTLFDELGWETGDEEPISGPPSSSAIAVPPRRPPAGHSVRGDELPSVIVDMDSELACLVDRLVEGQASEQDEGELLRQGESAMRVIMARFPGPVTFERSRIATMISPPRASDCGPLLRLIVRERKVALPFVLERLADPDIEVRGWATHVLCELSYPEAIASLLAVLRDSDASTRVSAARALRAIARTRPDEARDALSEVLAHSTDREARLAAIHAIAELGEHALVPDLMRALSDADRSVVMSAHGALIRVACQDFGGDARPWLRWWEANGSKHRIEWLIDALTHDVSEIRRSSSEQLRALSREYFGYATDLPLRDLERAQRRYRDWWIMEGRMRFERREG